MSSISSVANSSTTSTTYSYAANAASSGGGSVAATNCPTCNAAPCSCSATKATGVAALGNGFDSVNLSDDAKAKIEELKKIDRAVRAHESAHIAASGGSAGAATFKYTRGPDGQTYAISGEVGINVSKGRTPQETIEKAHQVRAAALAPADPSGQDYSVANEATQMEAQARAEIANQPLLQQAATTTANGVKASSTTAATTQDASIKAKIVAQTYQAISRIYGSASSSSALSLSA